MIVKVLVLILLFSPIYSSAQRVPRKTTAQKPVPKATVPKPVPTIVPAPADDELKQHLSAAQTYQLAGDLNRAATENQAVIAIALRRTGFLALEAEEFEKAKQYLLESAALQESSMTRASLAVAYMRLGEKERGIAEAQAAINLDPKNVGAYQILGSLHFSDGDYKAALPALEKVIQLAPDFDSAYLLGLTYLHLGQHERAKLLFEEIQNTVGKPSATLHMLFARAFDEADLPHDAEREFRRALAIDPKQPRGHFFLGFLLLQKGGAERLPEAAREFEQELALNPTDHSATFFLGVAQAMQNEHRKALGHLQKAVQLNPQKGQYYLFLGQSQLELGDLTGAEMNLRKAIELTGDVAKDDFQVRRAHFLLGRLLLRLGRREEAEKELARARELQERLHERDRNELARFLGQIVEKDEPPAGLSTGPAINKRNSAKLTPAKAAENAKIKAQLSELLAEAYHNLGVIAVQQGDLAGSLEKFAAAARWKPDFPGLDRNWGIVLFRSAQFDQAIAPLARHLRTDPQDNLVRRMLGVSHYFAKNFKDAVAILKPIEAVLTDDAELAYFYGIALVQSNLHREAENVFSRLAGRHQKSAEARFYAGQGFVMTGNYERAVQEFHAAAALDPQMPRVHYNAGQSLIRLNRFDEAEREFRRELELNPGDELAKYHLAFTYLERKIKTDEATALLTEAIAARPNYADAHYQLGKLAIEQNQIEKAIAHLETAARAEPDKDYIHYQLSVAYRRASRPADAERQLKIYRELKNSSRPNNSPMGNQ